MVDERTLAKRKGSQEKKMLAVFLEKDESETGQIGTTDLEDNAVTPAKMTLDQTIALTLPGTLGNDAGLNSDGVHIGEFTPQAVLAVADDGGTPTTETTEANEATADDMTLLPSTPAQEDAYYIGHATKQFCAVKLNQSTQGAGTWTIVVEYWNGSTWATLTLGLDQIGDFTAGSGNLFMTFEPPSDWETTDVNSISGYWIRWRVSAYTSVSTQPLGQQAWIYSVEDGNGVPMPNDGTISKAVMTCGTKSGANNDSVFLVVNLTQGTWDTITYTKALAIDIDATISLSVAQDDEIVIIQLDEDGTTEYANVSLNINITL